jgi:hypothetical protein
MTPFIPVCDRIAAAIDLIDFIMNDLNPHAVSFFLSLLAQTKNPTEADVQTALQMAVDRFACGGFLQ